jgi:hypothetical protein
MSKLDIAEKLPQPGQLEDMVRRQNSNRPEWRFFAFTSFQRRTGPSLSFGSCSRISLLRQS